MARVEGTVDPHFARVREVMEANLADGLELGAAISIVIDGRSVCDVWGGWRDIAKTKPWQRDTIVNVYSATKGIATMAALMLVDQGKLDLDRKAADYWPEFAAHGKGDVPVRWLFCHKAGVPGVRRALTLDDLYDFDRYAGMIAAEEPFWTPGTRHGYHALSIGHLLGMLIKLIDGRSIGRFVKDELSDPFGLDFHIGSGPELDGRIADMQMPPPPPPGEFDVLGEILNHPGSAGFQAFFNPPAIHPDVVNSRAWRGAELAAGNGHGNARGLARIYGALATDGRLDGKAVLSPQTIAMANTEQSRGPDAVLADQSTRFGLGFMMTQLDVEHAAFGPSPRAFGHPGAGGSLGYADPDTGIGFGYVMNQMRGGLVTGPRARELIDALYSCL
jgi:CubicO group peptidase (beta-lactamase class C family)